jgi:hypothetical protein
LASRELATKTPIITYNTRFPDFWNLKPEATMLFEYA